jgi:phospholipase/carboxylesterase
MTLSVAERTRLPEVPGPWRAIVMVHGWQGNEDVMWAFANSLPTEAAIFSPRGPLDVEGQGFAWFEAEANEAQLRAGVDALRAYIYGLVARFPLNPKRITLMGFSQGGAACISALLADPGLADGVAILAGFLPRPARAWVKPRRLSGKRVYIAHGLLDTTIPLDQAQLARDQMLRADADVTYGEYQMAHKLNPESLRDLKDWLHVHAPHPGRS